MLLKDEYINENNTHYVDDKYRTKCDARNEI